MITCGHIVPRQSDIIGFESSGYIAECVLPEGHKGSHMIMTPDRRFFGWEYDEGCTCEDCLDHRDSNNRCCVYWKVSNLDAESLLKNRD